MARKRRRSPESAPRQDDSVDGSAMDKGFLLTELTDLIATTTVSPRTRLPGRSRRTEVFKNDLRQPSFFWDLGPTANTPIKPEPVPEIVREPSPPVELGVTEKRLDGHRRSQYHPVVVELFKNQKNVWLRKNDNAKRVQASSFFWDKDPEEDDVDISADPDVAVVSESVEDAIMTEAEPVATQIDEVGAVAAVNIEDEPDAMLVDGRQLADSTSAIDVVMENSTTMHILYRDEDGVSAPQPGGDGRVGFKPAVDAIMEDIEPPDEMESLDSSREIGVSPDVDVAAIVDKIISEEAEKAASEALANESPPLQPTTSSDISNAPDVINVALLQGADVVNADADQVTTSDYHVKMASVESAQDDDIEMASAVGARTVHKVTPEQATTPDGHDSCPPNGGSKDAQDSDSSDTVIKDVIYVKTGLVPADIETSQPEEEQVDITVSEGSQAQ